ncbi:MAG: hypothetical protein EAZ13_09375 [Sphingobacteriia bacterium]|nr:MAG: hypothetical protein EAZ41_01625 [Sphingobacteriia bacterium]TAG29728.1 MAG: hypothetical protein EAZ35_09630 [Sphingobacteriia bacterium]TAH06460.1 MAG: hypothetical protein EAZ13_09375 [Sphingobacteriia bacterium]
MKKFNSSIKKSAQLYVLFLIFLVASCAKPKEFEYRDTRNIKLNSLGFNQSTLSFELVYFNPNNFGIDLKTVDSEVFIDSLYLGKFQLDTLMHIPKMSEFTLPSTIQLDMRNLMKNAAKLMFKKEVLIHAKGTVKAGKSGFYKTVPFTYQTKQSISLF